MKRDRVICSPSFNQEVGFNVIRNWLSEHSLCPLNQEFFTNIQPFTTISKIRDSQEFSDEFLAAFQRDDPPPLATIPDVTGWLPSLKITGYQLNPENFQQLYQILTLSFQLKRFLIKSKFPLWHSITRGLVNSKSALVALEKVFDENFQIRRDASQELKHLTKAVNQTENSINESMQRIFQQAHKEGWLGGDQIVFRNGRFVLPFKVSQKRKIKGVVQDQSATGQTAFVEPLEIIELNNQLTELQFAIKEEESRILKELTAYFQPLSDQIQESFNILQQIDRHFTVAKLAHRLKAIRPEIKENIPVILEKAVNPLFTLANKDAVSLTLELKHDKILLLSGPNAGGKTVVLKSLGLYALMAHCGLFIPAKKAQLPLFTQFMSDIGDRQSIEDDLSTFSAHIKRLSQIVDQADSKTLVLLDEIGTGTDPNAGAALSRAILENLLNNNCTVIATTHLGSLKVWASEERGIANGGMVFDSEVLSPTFELQLGTPGASYALEISKRMGLKKDIIRRSEELVGDGSLKLESILAKLEKESKIAESLKVELLQREVKLTEIESEILKKEKEINKTHRKAKSAAAKEAEWFVLNARKEIENLVSDIRKNEADSKSIQTAKKHVENILGKLNSQEQLEEFEYKSMLPKEAIPGTGVFLPHLNCSGKIIQSPDKKGKVRVEANGITLALKLSDLQPIGGTKEKQQNISNRPSQVNTSPLNSLRIDLRGKRVNEALQETEKFLDSALLSGLSFIHILHGKGTGALMEAIHEFLKNQPYISDFHFADEDQGGAGITVVELS